MNRKIYFKKQFTHQPLTPEDFKSRAIMRTLAGDERISLFASLRIIGVDQLAAFSASMNDVLTGHPEAIIDALAAMEGAHWFTCLVDDIEASADELKLQGQYDRAIGAMGGLSHDLAMQLRQSMRFTTHVFSRDAASERAEYDRIMSDRSSAANNRPVVLGERLGDAVTRDEDVVRSPSPAFYNPNDGLSRQ